MNNKHLYRSDEDIELPARIQPSLTEPTPQPSCVDKPAVIPPVFTVSKSVTEVFELDDTCIAPSKKTMLAGSKFGEVYEAQLNSLLYNDEERLDHSALMMITALSDIHTKTNRPMRLSSQSLRKKTPLVCAVLNRFFSTNHSVIRGISQQLA